jgi:aspartate racemase
VRSIAAGLPPTVREGTYDTRADAVNSAELVRNYMPSGAVSRAEAVVGVIGGMGPEATVELMRRVIAETPAADDADHIRLIVDNNPKVPSRIKALIDGTGENPGPVMARMARGLEAAGADFLVIPCNTAHHYWSYAAEAVSIPVWNLVDLTLAQVVASVGAPAKLGILASPALRQVRLYDPSCAERSLQALYPQNDAHLLQVIRAVKANGVGDAEIGLLQQAADELIASGADALVLACTEFSLLAQHLRADRPVLDTLQVLAEEIVRFVKVTP